MRWLKAVIRNRVTEMDVKEYLSKVGYCSRSARFDYLELVAIERPGWVQLFTFCVWARTSSGPMQRLYGVVRDDERIGIQVHVGETAEEQARVAADWSAGLITAGRKPLSSMHRILLIAFAVITTFALVGAFLSTS